MTRTSSLIATTLFAALGLATAIPAQAQNASRAWVSGAGVDQSGCGTFSSPCRTPQYAHDNIVAAGGEIDFLDPAGYGTIAISKAISLVNDGVGTTGMLAAAGNAITINAPSGAAVQLRGLTIEGSGAGSNGIVFNTGGSLTVINCAVENFAGSNGAGTAGNGILIEPTSGTIYFAITNTIAANNSYDGISVLPPLQGAGPNIYGVIDHVTATGNTAAGFSGYASAGSGTVAIGISNTVISNNTDGGIEVGSTSGGQITVSIDQTEIVGTSTGTGLLINNGNVLLGRSVITGNQSGISNFFGTVYTYKDNRINFNGSNNNANGTSGLTTLATE